MVELRGDAIGQTLTPQNTNRTKYIPSALSSRMFTAHLLDFTFIVFPKEIINRWSFRGFPCISLPSLTSLKSGSFRNASIATCSRPGSTNKARQWHPRTSECRSSRSGRPGGAGTSEENPDVYYSNYVNIAIGKSYIYIYICIYIYI